MIKPYVRHLNSQYKQLYFPFIEAFIHSLYMFDCVHSFLSSFAYFYFYRTYFFQYLVKTSKDIFRQFLYMANSISQHKRRYLFQIKCQNLQAGLAMDILITCITTEKQNALYVHGCYVLQLYCIDDTLSIILL